MNPNTRQRKDLHLRQNPRALENLQGVSIIMKADFKSFHCKKQNLIDVQASIETIW